MKGPEDILRFWFSERVEAQWFRASDAFDAEVRREFESTAIKLAADQSGKNSAHPWEEDSAQSHLALIIALDQFPRNMYRTTPAAFAWDGYALAAAKRMVARKADIHLTQTQRAFAYKPYMHSETLADQERSVELCDARLDTGNTLRFAKNHRDIIARFGRFPHRNKPLGRKNTEQEQSYLDEGGFKG